MIINIADFNGAEILRSGKYKRHMDDLMQTLHHMRLHLKGSDQYGLQGTAIFDPVGTNKFIADNLLTPQRGWLSGVNIPAQFSFLGKGVDFAYDGMLVEVQFSNYPFLLNNTLRAELLYKSKTGMPFAPPEYLVVITKAKMFPSSNSTLYYEQAHQQLEALVDNGVFTIPLCLVGLFVEPNAPTPAIFTRYHAARYSRTPVAAEERSCIVTPVGTRHQVGFI